MANTRLLPAAALHIIAFALVWAGNSLFANREWGREAEALWQGGALILAGLAVWLLAELRRERAAGAGSVPASETPALPRAHGSMIHPARVIGLLLGTNLSAAALVLNNRNSFTTAGVLAWITSMVVWWLVLNGSPRRRSAAAAPAPFTLRQRGVIAAAVVLILALGALFRLADLNRMPPEMTRDQAANLLDAYAIHSGYYPVFFSRNTGREPAQLYATALAASIPGVGLTFRAAKLVSAVEGLLTLLAVWWLARTIYDRHPALGHAAGAAAAALLAVSYWHTAQSRMGLRLVLAPLVVALLLVFLSRAARYNRRRDFLLAGLVLGLGLYTYISARLLPVVVLAGLLIVWRWGRRGEVRRYAVNTALLVVMAWVAFVPLFGYMLYQPEVFWSRIGGRLQGETFAPVVDSDGNLLYEGIGPLPSRTPAETAALFARNTANALMMYNWRGDEAWVSGIPYHPALDPFTGSLFLLGVITWGVRLVRRHDPADGLLAAAFLIMLLPSALSLAYPNENPSATRMNGTLPAVYVAAAAALLPLCSSVAGLLRGRYGLLAGGAVALMIVAGAAVTNADLYFNRYYYWYANASFPYRQMAAVIRDFGVPGNTFLVGYPMWVDEDILAIEAGVIDWMNYADLVDLLPAVMVVASERDGAYRFDPRQEMLFLLSSDDARGASRLGEWFPHGTAETVQSSHNGMTFVVYRAPPPGRAAFAAFIERQAENTR